MYITMYPTRPHPPAPLRPIRPDPEPAGQEDAQGRRAAPEVTREWPAKEPAEDPPSPSPTDRPLICLTAVALATTLAVALSPDALPIGLLVLLLLMDLSVAALLWRTPADRALRRAIRAIEDREHPVRVSEHR